MTKISMIVAMAENNVIGKAGKMPWYLPADLAWFKKNTLNKAVIMGRKTFKSIGFVLSNRQNIVVSRQPNLSIVGCDVASSPEIALRLVAFDNEVMIIGGAQLYRIFLPIVNRLYLTLIHQKIEGDTFFPDYNHWDWLEIKRKTCKPDEKNPYHYSFVILDKR